MKNTINLAFALLITAFASAQTTLPTGWNFDDPQPFGWLESLDNNPGSTRYTNNGYINNACKLDGDDEYVEVHFSDVCGSVNYFIWGSGQNLTNDIFTIQESVDGTSWTTMRELVGPDLNASSYTEYTDNPLATSRFIRWYFTEKQSGRNVGLDEITLEPQAATMEEEIAIFAEDMPVVNNSTYVVGNVASTAFKIKNINLSGGDTLNISDVQITGPDAGDFSLNGLSAGATVDAADSLEFDLNFSTVGTGSRFATLIITNDDANGDETDYTIDLYGIGGDYATEPTAAPTNFAFSNVTTYGYDVSFQDASTIPDGYIVIRGIENQFLNQPTDGETYVKGDYIDAFTQVVHVGPAGSFRPSYNIANTSYFYTAYSFNGPPGYENYLTASPLDGSVTTPETMMGNYYNGIDASTSSFLTDLQTRLGQNYNEIYYSNYASVVLNKFASRDTTGSQKVVTGVYTGFQYVYSGQFFFDVLSREHSWPHSWMPGYPDNDEDPEYSDLHNLFPAHQNGANAVRSNLPLGVVETVLTTFEDGTYGTDVNGNAVYEPRDQHKGDAARAIFYMAAKWNGTGGSWGLPNPISSSLVPYGQDQDVLKQWHWQDPPDSWEIARNDFIQSEQGNRNPFVDSVNWVCYIDFDDVSYLSNPSFPCYSTSSGIEEQLEGEFSVSPNPTSGNVTLTADLAEPMDLQIELMDLSGRLVMTGKERFKDGMTRRNFDLSRLDAGMYQLVIRGEKAITSRKLILQ